MQEIFFVILVGLVFWIMVIIWTWFPVWPKKSEVLYARSRINEMRKVSPLRFWMALILNSYLAYPIQASAIAVILSIICIGVIK